jgi:3'-phosphoadenosine 5'-phosphosulfate sulfotransferase (PAPS reductase)/FAD synthetase
MRDPFKIDGPTCISFSGGRTSAYMLWRVLQSNGGLPAEAAVCFANTGKENEETLRFVRDVEMHWGVPIRWLEYRSGIEALGNITSVPGDAPSPTSVVVSFQTASRDGEPFEALILRRRFLPNPVSRFCTSELKIRTMHRHLRSLGWTEWDQFVGIRADEQRRVSKIRARGTSTETKDDTMCMPLADAGVSVQDVGAFWRAQPFDLELPTVNGRTLEGNCDLCFLKPPAQRLALIAAKPERATWWIRMESFAESISEKPAGAKFNRYGEPSYTQLAAFARDQRDMFDPNEEAIACFCGD